MVLITKPNRFRSWGVRLLVIFLILSMTAFIYQSVLVQTADVGTMDLDYRHGVAGGWKGWTIQGALEDTHRPVPGVRGTAQEISTEDVDAGPALISVGPAGIEPGDASTYLLSFWYRRTGSNIQPVGGFLRYDPGKGRSLRFPLPPTDRWTYVEVLLPPPEEMESRIFFVAQANVTLQIDEVGLRTATNADWPAERTGLDASLFHNGEGRYLQPGRGSQVGVQSLQSGFLSSGLEIGTMELPSEREGLAGGWRAWNREKLPFHKSHRVIDGFRGGKAQRITTTDDEITAAILYAPVDLLAVQDPEPEYVLSFMYRLVTPHKGRNGVCVNLYDRQTRKPLQLACLEPSADWRTEVIPIRNPPVNAELRFVVATDDTVLDIDEVQFVTSSGFAGHTLGLLQPELVPEKLLWDRPPFEVFAPRGRVVFLMEHGGLRALLESNRWSLVVMALSLVILSVLSVPVASAIYGLMQGVVAWEPAPADLMWVLWTLSGVLSGAVMWQRFRKHTMMRGLILLFVVGNILSLSMASNKQAALAYALITLYGVLIFYTVSLIANRTDVRLFLGIGLIGGAVINALTAVAYAIGPEEWSLLFATADKRVFGFFKDPNVMGPFLVSGLLLVADRLRLQSRWITKFFIITLMLLLLFGIILTQGRAAVGALCISMAVLWFLQFHRNKKRDLRMVAVAALGVAAFVLLVGILHHFSLLRTDKITILKDYDVADRFPVQWQALKLGLSRPLGIGPGASEETFGLGTHSLYLRVLVENGWLGFAGLMGMIIHTTRELWRRIRAGGPDVGWPPLSALFAWWVGFLANSLVIDTLHWRHFWIFLGLIWVQIMRYDELKEQEQTTVTQTVGESA